MNLFHLYKNRKKVLGMNARNLLYVKRYNNSKVRKIADDKILTKEILSKFEIPTPQMVGSIRDFEGFKNFDWSTLPKSFVIKPVRGSEGAGIEIFYNQDKNGNWIKADGSKKSLNDIKHLAADILDGKFTPYAEPDSVLIEERVRPHKAFKYYAYKGTPDVRIIVFNNIPVMGYIRFPTKTSDGKGNMAQGAIGSGIDISDGRTTTSVMGKDNGGRGMVIKQVPGTKLNLSGLKIPYWNTMMEIAVECQQKTDIGFLAVDFLIDRDKGPMVVELTARTGLSGQIANQDGLRWRLKKAKGIKIKTIKQGIRVAKDLFGGEIEQSIETISGKELIGIYEDVTIFGINGQNEKTKAKIDTGADSTSIDIEVGKKLGYEEIINIINEIKLPQDASKEEAKELMEEYREKYMKEYEDLDDIKLVSSSHGISLRPKIKIKLQLGDLVFDTKANLYDRNKLKYKVIVGRKSLSKFLVDPGR